MNLLADDIGSGFFNILTSWSNPLILILFIVILIIFIIFFLNKYLVKPLEAQHIQEKKEIELKNSRMMALFSELDPDPVIRVDLNGKVKFFNEAAFNLFQIKNDDIIPEKIFNLSKPEFQQIVNSQDNFSFPLRFNNVHYNVLMKTNFSLGIVQFYLRDISEIKNLEIRLKQLSIYLQNQLDEERYRIAHELHDGIVQELYLVQMGLRKIPEDSYHKIQQLIQPIKTQIENTTEELRRIIYDLKPKILDEMGLEPALKTLCNNITNETAISGSVEIIGLSKRIDKKYEIYFYRIAQEAISNIIKHSGATEFSIFLIKEKEIIRMIISDNGHGLNENSKEIEIKSGFGLLNMRERTEGLGGIMKMDSSEEDGLTIIIEVPFNQN